MFCILDPRPGHINLGALGPGFYLFTRLSFRSIPKIPTQAATHSRGLPLAHEFIYMYLIAISDLSLAS